MPTEGAFQGFQGAISKGISEKMRLPDWIGPASLRAEIEARGYLTWREQMDLWPDRVWSLVEDAMRAAGSDEREARREVYPRFKRHNIAFPTREDIP